MLVATLLEIAEVFKFEYVSGDTPLPYVHPPCNGGLSHPVAGVAFEFENRKVRLQRAAGDVECYFLEYNVWYLRKHDTAIMT